MAEEIIKEEKRESKIYRLEEMADAILKSKENAEEVFKQQLDLMDYLKKDEENRFEELIESMENQNSDLKNQIETLKIRHNLLLKVIEKSKEKEENDNLINTLLDALGVFEN